MVVAPRIRIRIRTLLTILVFAATVPLGLFGGWLISRSGLAAAERVDREDVETARAIAVGIDQTIGSTLKALGSLAALDAELAPEQFRVFAERVLPTQPSWHGLFLSDASGRPLADTTPGFGDPQARREWARRIAATGRGSVSDLARDPATGLYYVDVGVPVLRPQGPPRVLGARILARTFGELLRREDLPQHGLVTLIDGSHRIIARTQNEERYVGGPPSPGFEAASERMNEGSWRDVTLEGMPAQRALSRVSTSGWTVGVAVPADDVDAMVRGTLGELAAAGLFWLGAGTLTAMALGELLFRSLAHATAAASSLARGEPVAVRASHVIELDQLGRGLGDAAGVLRALLEKERAARAEAEAANRGKDEFVAIVSHELRTPLSAISGWVQLLEGGNLDEAQRQRALEVIARNVRLQSQLINDLLDVSRMVTGNLNVELRPVELAPVVEAAVDAVRPDAERRRIPIGVAVEPTVGRVAGDPDRLQQVVWNLLVNALKFTPPGGRIDVAVRHADEDVVLAVRDTGIGIPADFLPHVFERFRQGAAPASNGQDGLGIGLALVQHLVELHGGRIAVASEGEGRGAEFTVRLPACEATAIRGGERRPALEQPAAPASS